MFDHEKSNQITHKKPQRKSTSKDKEFETNKICNRSLTMNEKKYFMFRNEKYVKERKNCFKTFKNKKQKASSKKLKMGKN